MRNWDYRLIGCPDSPSPSFQTPKAAIFADTVGPRKIADMQALLAYNPKNCSRGFPLIAAKFASKVHMEGVGGGGSGLENFERPILFYRFPANSRIGTFHG